MYLQNGRTVPLTQRYYNRISHSYHNGLQTNHIIQKKNSKHIHVSLTEGNRSLWETWSSVPNSCHVLKHQWGDLREHKRLWITSNTVEDETSLTFLIIKQTLVLYKYCESMKMLSPQRQNYRVTAIRHVLSNITNNVWLVLQPELYQDKLNQQQQLQYL